MSFWYPYRDGHDAATRLGAFADAHVGPACGVTWSDGQQVAVLRAAHAGGDGAKHYLNVLCHRGLPPPPAPAKPVPPPTFLHEAEGFAWSVLQRTHLTPDEIKADAQAAGHAVAAGAAKVYRAGRDNVWEPVHNWVSDPKHKTWVDFGGVVLDAVGVAAGVGFVLAFSPAIGAVAVVTGGLAFAGSITLLVADSAVWGTEVTGHKAKSERLENSAAVRWMRIVGTVAVLPDVVVGGPRALTEVHKLGKEIDEGLELAGKAEERMVATRAQAKAINRANPTKANKLRHQANLIAREAAEHHAKVAAAATKRVGAVRDVGAAFGATPAGTALFSIAPPANLLTKAQREADAKKAEAAEKHAVEPEGGMPKDVHLEMRMSVVSKGPKR